ncbi:MAG: hypothetical protein O8C62_04175 [Candidatus Methanoperedens sp.]|nr:hypothetical protein [Candidatus Methanoperedens sp.]
MAVRFGGWKLGVRCPFRAEMVGAGAELIAVYEASESPEALANGVWTGCLRSEPVRWRLATLSD